MNYSELGQIRDLLRHNSALKRDELRPQVHIRGNILQELNRFKLDK